MDSRGGSGGGIYYLNPGYTSIRMGRIEEMIRGRLEEASALLTVDVEVFEASGDRSGEAVLTLGPGDRTAQTLRELIPGWQEQAGGFIVVSGSGPLVGQELFGTFDLRLQSAVPPTITD